MAVARVDVDAALLELHGHSPERADEAAVDDRVVERVCARVAGALVSLGVQAQLRARLPERRRAGEVPERPMRVRDRLVFAPQAHDVAGVKGAQPGERAAATAVI